SAAPAPQRMQRTLPRVGPIHPKQKSVAMRRANTDSVTIIAVFMTTRIISVERSSFRANVDRRATSTPQRLEPVSSSLTGFVGGSGDRVLRGQTPWLRHD